MKYSQFIFISIALYTIKIVSKQLQGNKSENDSVIQTEFNSPPKHL